MLFRIMDLSGRVLHTGIIPADSSGVKIGGGEKCDVKIHAPGIAAEHVQLQINRRGEVTIQDIQSPFGIWIDKTRIPPGFLIQITPKDKVKLSDELILTIETTGEGDVAADYDESSPVIFPFFMAQNERQIRHVFAKLREDIPAQFHPPLRAVELEVAAKVKELSGILEVSMALNSIFNFQKLLEFTLEMAISVTEADRGFIMLFNEELDRLETVIQKKMDPRSMAGDLSAVSPLVMRCFRTGRTLVLHENDENDIGTDQPFARGIRAVAATPLRNENASIGVLYLDSRRSAHVFDERTQEILKVFAAQASSAIHRARLFHLATTDGLTGMANQKHFHQRLLEEFWRAKRHKEDLSLVLLDLDAFHQINEKYGRSAGDRVLKRVSRLFKACMRVHDLVARYGDDKFALLLPQTASEGATTVAEKLRSLVEKTVFRSGKQAVYLTASLGVAALGARTAKPMDLFSAAEQAMQSAKSAGGNRVASLQRSRKKSTATEKSA